MAENDLPASPADELPLPSILGDDETDPALALLTEDEVAATQADGDDKEAGEDEEAPTVDKELQQRQQKLANREKAVLAAQEKLDAATERLEKLAERLAQNPTPANEKAVESATRQSVKAEALAKIAALKATPDFDRYRDGDKIDEIWAEALGKLEEGQVEAIKETAATKAQREAEAKHDAWWASWAQKNPVLGREAGEKLWSKATAQAKAEAKTSANEGVPITEGQAALLVFRRLVAAAKKAPAPDGKEKGPDGSGGRLGPTGGRAGGTVRQRDPLDEIFSDEDFRAGKYGDLA